MRNWFSKLLTGILVIGVLLGSTGLESKASSCNSFKPSKNIISVKGIKYKLPSDSYGSGIEPEYEYYDGKRYQNKETAMTVLENIIESEVKSGI